MAETLSGWRAQNLPIDSLGFDEFFFFLEVDRTDDLLVFLAEPQELAPQRLGLVHVAHAHEESSEFHARLLPAGVESERLLEGFRRGRQLALREKEVAARFVRAFEFREEGKRFLDVPVSLVEATEPGERARRQAEKVGVVRELAQHGGGDLPRGLGFSDLQELLRALKQLLLLAGDRESVLSLALSRQAVARTPRASIAAGIASRLPRDSRLTPETPGIVASSSSISAQISMPSRSGSAACSILSMIDAGTSAPLTLSLTQCATSADGNGDNAMMKLRRCVNCDATIRRM